MLIQDAIWYEGVEPTLFSFPQRILSSIDGHDRVIHVVRTGDARLALDSTLFSHSAMKYPQCLSHPLLILSPIQS